MRDRGPAGPIDVMGVLNVTPDSFSDGGAHLDPSAAHDWALEMLAAGACVVDVGGESTRPGAEPVDPEEERRRVLPVLERIAGPVRDAGGRISIDTRHESTARAAVAAGATLINDVGATLAPVAAELGVGWVAMHMAGDPATMQTAPAYTDVVDEVRAFLSARAAAAVAAGVGEVWVDPGIGFGKTTEHNLALLAQLDRLVADGFPVLVGTSRKRFTGELVARSDAAARGRGGGPGTDPTPSADRSGNLAPADVPDRLDASLATATWAMVHGAAMVRAHDVEVTVQAARIVGGVFADH